MADVEGRPEDEALQKPDDTIRHVIFVIHGIRDAGYWTHKVARRVRKRGRDEGLEFATETTSYGYFPMLPFLFGWKRREKVEWLMDQYAEKIALYPNPNTDFYYIGHRNAFQVQDVLNYVATRDMVVACFPKLFETLHIPDLGGAGHDGFVKHLSVNAEFLKEATLRHAPGATGGAQPRFLQEKATSISWARSARNARVGGRGPVCRTRERH